jgi:hypothetical protein
MSLKYITFDEGVKKFVLNSFDKEVTSDGFVVEKENTEQKVITPDGDELTEQNFAGIKKGSEVYIKSDIVSLVRLASELV